MFLKACSDVSAVAAVWGPVGDATGAACAARPAAHPTLIDHTTVAPPIAQLTNLDRAPISCSLVADALQLLTRGLYQRHRTLERIRWPRNRRSERDGGRTDRQSRACSVHETGG